MSTSRAVPSPDLNEHSLHDIDERAAPGDAEVADWARLQARQELAVVVRKIWRRANARSLDRGLTLSLPYFDDDAMEIRQREVEVIPRGRIMFVPAFVVLAARRERERVATEVGMSEGTRRHLIELLEVLEHEFGGPTGEEWGRPPMDR